MAADESELEAVAAAAASASVMDSVKLARMVLRRLRCATSLRIGRLPRRQHALHHDVRARRFRG